MTWKIYGLFVYYFFRLVFGPVEGTCDPVFFIYLVVA
ncbi:hypothetical protein LCGC14_0664060 [marine sediment metagenome]|uniref:Uncharacterized protein n=1 Tax=marine sediment metagenome TaxID=412755 RepID=A0A0F9TE55_9ZZZZ